MRAQLKPVIDPGDAARQLGVAAGETALDRKMDMNKATLKADLLDALNGFIFSMSCLALTIIGLCLLARVY